MEYGVVMAIERLARRRTGEDAAEVRGFAYRPASFTSASFTSPSTQSAACTSSTSWSYSAPFIRVFGVNPDG